MQEQEKESITTNQSELILRNAQNKVANPGSCSHGKDTSDELAEFDIVNDDRPAISPHVGLFARLTQELKKYCRNQRVQEKKDDQKTTNQSELGLRNARKQWQAQEART